MPLAGLQGGEVPLEAVQGQDRVERASGADAEQVGPLTAAFQQRGHAFEGPRCRVGVGKGRPGEIPVCARQFVRVLLRPFG